MIVLNKIVTEVIDHEMINERFKKLKRKIFFIEGAKAEAYVVKAG